MKAEIRSDGLHIVGYVNVPGRESRPVNTPRGRVIEVIEQRAFGRAVEKTKSIKMLLDHDPNRVLASTEDRTLKLEEDEVGLRAEAIVTDEETIKGAKAGKLRGWSFKMQKVVDEVEERAGKLPLRTIKDFIMPEVTLVMNKIPVYNSTSIEFRAEDDESGVQSEIRAAGSEITVETPDDKSKETFNNSEFRKRAENLKA